MGAKICRIEKKWTISINKREKWLNKTCNEYGIE